MLTPASSLRLRRASRALHSRSRNRCRLGESPDGPEAEIDLPDAQAPEDRFGARQHASDIDLSNRDGPSRAAGRRSG